MIMQRQLINTLAGLAMLTGAALAAPALAADAAAFDRIGTIDWMDTKQSTNNIVIGDRSLTLGSTVRVHTPQGTTGMSALRPGVRVGYRSVNHVLTDLWVLPAE
jgi:hypothetical protein